MAIDQDTAISILNDLIQTCRDGQEGFRNAAEHARDPHLKELFAEFSTQRAQFLGVLQNEVQRLGEPDPEKRGSIAASAHRGWMDLKAKVLGRDDHALLEEAERGEDVAVASYDDALGKGLPADLREIVEAQYLQVKQVHDKVRELRNSLARS